MRVQLLRFAAVGCVNVAIDLGIYSVLVFVGLPMLLANAISTACGLCFSFFANRRFTFQLQGRRAIWRQALVFVVVVGFGLWVIQPVVITIMTSLLSNLPAADVWVVVGAKLVAIGVALVWNFIMFRWVVFASRTGD